MFAAPTMIKLMVESPALEKFNLGSLRSLNYGGAPMLVEDLKEAVRNWGHVSCNFLDRRNLP